MKACPWLGRDGYEYILFCTKADAAEIIGVFGPHAKAPTLPMRDGIKYSFYLLNTVERIITPLRHLSWVFGGHADPYAPLVGDRECTVAVFLDRYTFREYAFRG